MSRGANWSVRYDRSWLTVVPIVAFVGLVGAFALSAFGTYPPFVLSTVFLLLSAAFVVVRFGPFSVPSLFTALLTYPLVVPFFSEYLFDVSYYAYRGRIFQTPPVVNKTVFLGSFMLTVFVVVLEVRSRITSQDDPTNVKWTASALHYSVVPFGVLAILHLGSAYLTTPGPTILTVSYSEVLANYYPWAQFAGSLYMGSWISLYLLVRGESNDSWAYRSFMVLTSVGIVWLLLHARRNESLGVLVMFTLDLLRNRVSLRDVLRTTRGFVASAVFFGLFAIQILIGSFRFEGGEFGAPDFAQPSGYASYPGGAHNIYGTFQATVAIFPDIHPFLLGETFVRYVPQTIPSGFFAILPITFPPLYSSFLADSYATYLGGNFILNPYYANFGPFGLVFLAIVLSLLVYWVEFVLFRRKRTTFTTGIASVFVVGAFRACWYTQLAWIDTFQGYVASLVLVLGVFVLGTTDLYEGLDRSNRKA